MDQSPVSTGLSKPSPRTWLLSCTLAWGVFGVCSFSAKMAANTLPGTSVAVWWVIGYVPITFAIAWVLGFPRDLRSRAAAIPCIAGVIAQMAALFFYWALAGGKASVVVPLTALYPVVTLGLALLILGERLSLRQSIGVALAFTAIFLFSL